VTNSGRFDVNTIGNRLDQPDTFGVYTNTLTNPRVIQLALRCGILERGADENDEGLVRVRNKSAKCFVCIEPPRTGENPAWRSPSEVSYAPGPPDYFSWLRNPAGFAIEPNCNSNSIETLVD